MSAIQDPTLGISIAIAIAIHNIPEGISVSVPIYFATGDRKKAFFYSFLSGLSEPVGALIGYFVLFNFLSEALFGIVFAGVAGIMVYISLDELLPTAEKYGKHHIAIGGLIAGMIVMAISLVLFV
jgi:ZIP family zinc transporter